jgi:putative ABC transport system substrate-binding protein
VNRRDFITLLGGATAAWPLAARAQPAERMRRVGVLMTTPSDDPESQARLAAFVKALQELGWTDGRNVQFDVRFGTRAATTGQHAAEMVALAPDDAPVPWFDRRSIELVD